MEIKIMRVPYSILIGLLMLAGVAIGTTGCETTPSSEIDSTIVSQNPIQKKITDMLSTLGITAITTKSTTANKGDLIEYKYRDYYNYDKNSYSVRTGKINLEESNDKQIVYDEINTDEISTATFRRTFTETEDGIKMKREIYNKVAKEFHDAGEYFYVKDGNKIIKTWDLDDEYYAPDEKGKAVYEAGKEPNSVILDGKKVRFDNISIVLKN